MSIDEAVESPITFTDAAAHAIRESATKIPEAKGKELRVAVRGGGCSGFSYALDYDVPRSMEEIHEHNGVRYLLDPISERYLRGTTIDYVGGLGAGFRFINPNTTGTCGCGHSFSA